MLETRLEQAREGYRRRAWNETYRLLADADQSSPLAAADLELLAMSAYLTGREPDFDRYLERAHHAHVQQAEQIRLYKEAWKKAGHQREPRVSVSRSIFALVSDQDRYLFGQENNRVDKIGMIEQDKRAIFGRSYAAEPDQLIKELAADEAIREADTLLLTVPNTLGVDYNVHVLSSILKHVAPGLGWR